VPRKPEPCRRSGCPVNIALEAIGDRWSLLIVRDMMLRGFRTYQEFLDAGEGIATNILADRLRKLEDSGIVSTSRDPDDRRKLIYRLTQKGMDLGPVLMELVLWSARYEATDASRAMLQKVEKDRSAFMAEIRRKWQEGEHRDGEAVASRRPAAERFAFERRQRKNSRAPAQKAREG